MPQVPKKKNSSVQSKDGDYFIREYEAILKNQPENTVVVNTQWNQPGDTIQQFSLYDENFIPIPSLGNTTPMNFTYAELERSPGRDTKRAN